MGVGCPCPPVRNDIVTPRHLFSVHFLFFFFLISLLKIRMPASSVRQMVTIAGMSETQLLNEHIKGLLSLSADVFQEPYDVTDSQKDLRTIH